MTRSSESEFEDGHCAASVSWEAQPVTAVTLDPTQLLPLLLTPGRVPSDSPPLGPGCLEPERDGTWKAHRPQRMATWVCLTSPWPHDLSLTLTLPDGPFPLPRPAGCCEGRLTPCCHGAPCRRVQVCIASLAQTQHLSSLPGPRPCQGSQRLAPSGTGFQEQREQERETRWALQEARRGQALAECGSLRSAGAGVPGQVPGLAKSKEKSWGGAGLGCRADSENEGTTEAEMGGALFSENARGESCHPTEGCHGLYTKCPQSLVL